MDFSAVFVHGRFGKSSHWDPVVARLEGAARCRCIDLPSSGVSLVRSASLLEEIVNEANAPVILVGHDIGGTIALMSAIRLASRLDGLVLIGPACLTCPPAGLRPGFLARRRLRGRIALDRERLRTLRAYGESWPRHYERLAWKRALPSVSQPALLLWGSRDEVSPVSFGNELVRRLPDAELLQHPTASYWLPVDDPTWVAARIREFLFRLGNRFTVRRSLWR